MSEVLNHNQIKKKITRIAYEIYERNLGSGAVVFAGICGIGKSNLVKSEVELSSPIELEGKTLLIVDDVLNTGKTLAYAMKPFLDVELYKMEVAVLVNRSHGLFPIRPDYTGYELSTTLNEHIRVDFSSENNYSVHLL
jgi:pyrimidine operon attenuation protein/uracil phosphoribosyltransferase